MKFLLFSDTHCNTEACEEIVRKSKGADFLIGAGDYALFRKNLQQTIEALSGVNIPAILVPGNHESYDELVMACENYKNFHVLHGNQALINGITFVGIGCGIPKTPFGSWSVDLSENDAASLLPHLHRDFIFITHSPPFGCLDKMANDQHAGSKAIRSYIEKVKPSLVVCGHIHENWHRQSDISGIPVINAGPVGYIFDKFMK